MGNSDTEDEGQDHVEVINLTVTEVTKEAAAVTPPELPMTLDQFQQSKVDVAFAGVSTDIRMRKGKKKLPVERLPKDWDVKRKES